MRRSLPYRLDDSWASRGGPVRWHPGATVTLEAVLRSAELAAVRNAVAAWLSSDAVARDDAGEAPLWYTGGCRVDAPVHDDAATPPTTTVHLWSTGEDAFDAVADGARQLYDAATRADPGVSIRWSELPHREG